MSNKLITMAAQATECWRESQRGVKTKDRDLDNFQKYCPINNLEYDTENAVLFKDCSVAAILPGRYGETWKAARLGLETRRVLEAMAAVAAERAEGLPEDDPSWGDLDLIKMLVENSFTPAKAA